MRYRIFERPGLQRMLSRELPSTSAGALRASLPAVRDAFAALADLVRPAALELGLIAIDRDGKVQTSDRVGPELADPAGISAEAMAAWIEREVAMPSEGGRATWWREIRADVTRVRVPDEIDAAELTFMGHRFRVPVELHAGGKWVTGSTTTTDEPPIRVVCELNLGALWLSIQCNWSVWTDPGSPGRALLDRVAKRIAALGWEDRGMSGEAPPPADVAGPVAGDARSTVDGGRIAIGDQVVSGTADEVRVATLPDGARALATFAGTQTVPFEALRAQLAFAHPQIAALEFVGAPDPGTAYASALVERLPPGTPASAHPAMATPVVAQLGAAIASVLAAEHAHGRAVVGIRPELIYVGGDGRFTGLVPRGPAFLASAEAIKRGFRSYFVLYTSPEVAGEGAPPTPASDLFALCIALWQLATGAHPFGDRDAMGEMFMNLLAGKRAAWTGDPALGAVLARGLAADPAARPTAKDLAEALARL